MARQRKGRLPGQRVLITGASSGVGEATARLFAAEGAKVALVARRRTALRRIAGELGQNAIALPADVADPKCVARVVGRAARTFGGLDIVVNSAGIIFPLALKDLTPQLWQRQIDVNLSGTFHVAREAALRMMEGNGGSIVNVGSELSLVGAALYAAYCASKAGVMGLTKALALELAPKVRVNCICPGPIDTPMMDSELAWFPDPEATRQAAVDRVPLKRFATAEEVAEAILFIAVAPYCTGSIFSVDGGTTAI